MELSLKCYSNFFCYLNNAMTFLFKTNFLINYSSNSSSSFVSFSFPFKIPRCLIFVLLSVTGHIAGGPFSSGWLFLLAVVICLPCIIYGRMSGQWHTEKEILVGLSAEIVRCADCFVTCIVASQLVATMRYVCLFDLLGWSDTLITLAETIVYALPFIWRWLMSSGAHRIS